jgi:hypothetical protein
MDSTNCAEVSKPETPSMALEKPMKAAVASVPFIY